MHVANFNIDGKSAFNDGIEGVENLKNLSEKVNYPREENIFSYLSPKSEVFIILSSVLLLQPHHSSVVPSATPLISLLSFLNRLISKGTLLSCLSQSMALLSLTTFAFLFYFMYAGHLRLNASHSDTDLFQKFLIANVPIFRYLLFFGICL